MVGRFLIIENVPDHRYERPKKSELNFRDKMQRHLPSAPVPQLRDSTKPFVTLRFAKSKSHE